MSKPIIAVLYPGIDGEVEILTPDQKKYPYSGVGLTEDHIQELISLNRAYYQKQLVEGIKAGLISSNPPDSKL